MAHHALVFGASGILGWAVVNEILNNYPKRGTYSKVTALTNRPLTRDVSLWPEPGADVPELSIVSGVDLTQGTVDDMEETFIRRVPDIDSVTHIYYFAYFYHSHFPTESKINLGMMQRGLGAVEKLAPKLSYVIFPTGTKGYGVHMPSRVFKAPFKESMGEIPSPWRDELFYYVLRGELTRMQQGKAWKWAEVRSDIVVGFVPNSNPYNFPGLYMNFLSLYKYMHKKGHPDALCGRVPFPSVPSSYHTISNDCNQDIFGRFSIHLCLNPDQAGTGELYNIADESTPRSMADRWPFICSLFGVEGVPAVDPSSPESRTPVRFIRKHLDQLKLLQEEKWVVLQSIGLEEGIEMWMEHLNFNHDLVVDKARATGFSDEMPYKDSWKTVFERYERAKKAYLREQ